MRTLLSLIFLALFSSSCTNPEVPAGHEGYVYKVPLLFGQMEYKETLRGPTSTSISWRLFVENIDMRTRSYTEEFQLLTKDNLSVSFEVNTRISLKDGSTKEIVEEWGGVDWYEWNVKEQLRTIVREQVTEFSATTLQLETPKVRAQVETKLAERYENPEKPTPIHIESVDIGQIQFPVEVAEAIQRKIATKQELERQRFLLSKTEKEAAIKVLEAINVAKQQLIISSTLDPLYVQHRAVQVYRSLAQSSNQTVITLPNSSEGTGMPLVLKPKQHRDISISEKKTLTARLNRMENEYTKRAQSAIDEVEEPTMENEAPESEKASAPVEAVKEVIQESAPAEVLQKEAEAAKESSP